MDVVERRVRFQGTGTIFKILPMCDAQSNRLTPLTPFLENGAPGDWIRSYPSVRLLTPIGVIRYRPYNPRAMSSVFSNPVVRLKSSVSAAISQGFAPQSWRALFDRSSYSNNQNLPIVFDQSCYFFLCALFTLGVDGSSYNPPMFPVLLQCSKSAGEAIRRCTSKDLLYDLDVMVKLTPRPGGAGSTPGSFTPSHYEVSILRTSDLGISPEVFDSYIRQIEQEKITWDQVEKIPSVEDQIMMLAGSSIPPSLMAYTFGDEYSGILDRNYWVRAKEELERELNGRPTGAMPFGVTPMAPAPFPSMQQPYAPAAFPQQAQYAPYTPPAQPVEQAAYKNPAPQPMNQDIKAAMTQPQPQQPVQQGQSFFYQQPALNTPQDFRPTSMPVQPQPQPQPQTHGTTSHSSGMSQGPAGFNIPQGATVDVDSDIPIPPDVKQVLANLNRSK